MDHAPPTLDYPVQTLENVAPTFVRAMIIQAMAVQYARSVPGLTLDEAFDAARATWKTEWSSDPAPRTFEAAREVVSDDLECWEE